MSKTHWGALISVLLTAVKLSGLIDGPAIDGALYIINGLMTGTLIHRGYKLATVTAS